MCRQPNKVIRMPQPVANPYQHARDNRRGARLQGGPSNDLRPPNLYYDHGNARQTFHPPAGLQTSNGYISIQNRPVDPQPPGNRRQTPPNDPGPSNSQGVRFMDGTVETHTDESFVFQVPSGEEHNQWPPNTNVITYELRRLDDGTTCEAPALAVTTRASGGNLQEDKDVEEQEEYSSDEAPHLSDLDSVARTARRATKALEVEIEILQNRERPNVIHDLEGSEMDEWKGPRIPLDEFDGMRRAKEDKPNGYDLWADLSSLKADITFRQLLEI